MDRLIWLFSNEIEALQSPGTTPIENPVSLPERKKYLLRTQGQHYRFDFDPRASQEYAVFQDDDTALPEDTPQETATSITSLDLVVRGKLGTSLGFADAIHSRLFRGSDRYNPYPADLAENSHRYGEFQNSNSMEGYLLYRFPWLTIEIGRDELWWGPGWHGALTLSDNSASKDLIKLSGQYDWIGFTALTATLREPSDVYIPKYLSAHRLEIQPVPGVQLGVDEVVVYADRFEASYLNPVIIYFITEPGLEKSPDNRLLGLDFDLTLMPRIEFYGELMIDDFRSQEGINAFRAPETKFGVLLGAYWVDPLGLKDTDLRIEYAFINQFAYTHDAPETRYLHDGRIIGHWLGTDAEDLWLFAQHWFTPTMRMRLVYERERHGEGDVTKSLPYRRARDSALPPEAQRPDQWEYLSGVVETTHTIALGFSLHLIGRYLFDVEYALLKRENIANQVNADRDEGRLVIQARYQF